MCVPITPVLWEQRQEDLWGSLAASLARLLLACPLPASITALERVAGILKLSSKTLYLKGSKSTNRYILSNHPQTLQTMASTQTTVTRSTQTLESGPPSSSFLVALPSPCREKQVEPQTFSPPSCSQEGSERVSPSHSHTAVGRGWIPIHQLEPCFILTLG